MSWRRYMRPSVTRPKRAKVQLAVLAWRRRDTHRDNHNIYIFVFLSVDAMMICLGFLLQEEMKRELLMSSVSIRYDLLQMHLLDVG